LFFFFFQAEDGIRDRNVTGVQTCALPILRTRARALVDPEQIDMETSLAQTRAALAAAPLHPMPLFVLTHGRVDQPDTDPRINAEIGRASCRERGENSRVAAS